MKTCKGCGESLPESMFATRTRRDRGVEGQRFLLARCIPCQRADWAAKDAERRAANPLRTFTEMGMRREDHNDKGVRDREVMTSRQARKARLEADEDLRQMEAWAENGCQAWAGPSFA